jgi:hypothetical protein
MLAASKVALVALVALVGAAALGFVLLTRGEGARGGWPTAELAAAAPAAQQASVEPLEAPSAERSESREERERTPTKGTEPPSTEVVRTSAARPLQGMLLMISSPAHRNRDTIPKVESSCSV